MKLFPQVTAKQHSNLLALLFWRAALSALLLFVTDALYEPVIDIQQQGYFFDLMMFWLANFVLQGLLCSYVSRGFVAQLFYQLATDLLMVGILIFLTGGFHSPFVLLLGLMIVIAGTQARVLLVLVIAVLACVSYLASVYLFAWLQPEALPEGATLKLLLQTSVFFLVGGVMAVISRRHAELQRESERVVQAHHALQRLHSDLMTSMQEGILVLDEDLKVVDCNPSFLQVLHQDDVVGEELSRLADFPEVLFTSLLSDEKQPCRMEWQYMEATYLLTVGYFSQTQAHAYCWLTLVDISMVRQLEKQLMEQERLASLGRLAAMLAHEFRNPMQTIGQATELMTRLPANTQQKVQRIVAEEVQRLNRLVTDMLDYARPVAGSIEHMDVRSVVETMLQQDEWKDYHIVSHVDVDTVDVDVHHWRRVLENLLHHAVAASPEPRSVHVKVSSAGEGGWCLCVQDAGEMLSESMRVQMFEPFGEHRGGTGLGLATVWQICEGDGWSLQVDSQQDMTCLCVRSGKLEGVEHG